MATVHGANERRCDNCGAPLFPNREGELVHAEMPEQPNAAGSQILH